MKKAYLNTLPDVLCAKDVAQVLGVGYVKALSIIRFGGLPYIKVGRTYHVSKQNFTDWLNGSECRIISLD